MLNKNLITLIILILVISGITVIYGYFKTPEQINSNIDFNSNTQKEIKGPLIKVIPESYDLGLVKYGEVVKHTFTIKNSGSEPLEILKLSTSCGCTKASVDDADKTIAPGQSIDMLVTFDPAVHQDDADFGNVTRIVYIKTNNPTDPEIEIEIKANVVKKD